MTAIAGQAEVEVVRHELRPSRMKGTVTVRFDRDHSGRRRIRFGGENYGDDAAEEVEVNGKRYRMCAAALEESPGVWRADRGYDILRVPGSLAKGTDRARAAVREECQAVAPAYAEKYRARFDLAVAEAAVDTARGYLRAAEDAERTAKLLREQAELVQWIADGEVTVRPWTPAGRGRRLRMEFGAARTETESVYRQHAGRAEVVAHLVNADGEIVGYLGVTDRRSQVWVPEGHVLQMFDR